MHRSERSTRLPLLLLALSVALLGCDRDGGGILQPIEGGVAAPRSLVAEYAWLLQGWEPGGVEPVGQPSVELTWELPSEWDREPFRVYARRDGDASYTLAATVTSCAEGLCRYTDLNVAPGRAYAYYVAAVDERSGRETASDAVQLQVPAAGAPEAPTAPRVTALDGALFLQWESTGAERYRVFLERIDGDGVFFAVGETDGTGFLDERAENGVEYAYRIAAIDTLGHVSARSPLGAGIARPDYHAELIYAFEDSAAASGFRFRGSDAESPIVAGDASDAQWRLEVVDGALSLRPLGETRVTAGEFTTALTCGPGSELDCLSVDEAPAASAFGSAPVPVESASTYVFRVVGDDGRVHHAKVRVQGRATDGAGRPVVVFDWAYQLVADEPSLSRG